MCDECDEDDVADRSLPVFEDKALAEQANGAVEKVIHHEDMEPIGDRKTATGQAEAVEDVTNKSRV